MRIIDIMILVFALLLCSCVGTEQPPRDFTPIYTNLDSDDGETEPLKSEITDKPYKWMVGDPIGYIADADCRDGDLLYFKVVAGHPIIGCYELTGVPGDPVRNFIPRGNTQ